MSRLIDGDWRDIASPDSGELAARFREAWLETLPPDARSENAGIAFSAVRAMPLPCYPRTLLCEVETLRSPEELAIAAFLYGPFGIRIIDGASQMIHDLNIFDGIVLETPEQAEAYGRFFCSAVHGNEGRFEIVESVAQLGGQPLDEKTLGRIAPLSAEPREERWRLEGVVRYGPALFATTFDLDRDGHMQMEDDEALVTMDQPVEERFEAPFRLLRLPPADGETPQ